MSKENIIPFAVAFMGNCLWGWPQFRLKFHGKLGDSSQNLKEAGGNKGTGGGGGGRSRMRTWSFAAADLL